MSTGLGSALLTAVLGVLVIEFYQTTPWLAGKLVRWSVRLRYADHPERAAVRGEELAGLLQDLPTLLKLPTAIGFLSRALIHHLYIRIIRSRSDAGAVRRFPDARFRSALVKAFRVTIGIGVVFGAELFVTTDVGLASVVYQVIPPLSLIAGVSVASNFVIRLPKFNHGVIGGIVCAFSIFLLNAGYSVLNAGPTVTPGEAGEYALLGGVAFMSAMALMNIVARRVKYAYLAACVVIHAAGLAFIVLAGRLVPSSDAIGFIGFGLAVGALAGLLASVELRAQRKMSRTDRPVVTGEVDLAA